MVEVEKILHKKTFLVFIFVVLIGILAISSKNSNPDLIIADAEKILDDCQALDRKEQCYAKAFENLTNITDRDYSFEVLRALQEIDSEARGCHFIAHSISTAETQKDPSKWRELMNTAPQDCSYGAAHGVLEVYASTFPDGKLPKKEIPNICNNPDTNNCTHILGHILLVMNENDIDESLNDCESLPNNSHEKFECLSGVFMEKITALNLINHSLATRDALDWGSRVPELETLCKSQAGTRYVACWKEIVHAALVKYDNDPQQTIDFCEKGLTEDAVRKCIDHSLGILAGHYNFELDRIGFICDSRVREPDFKDRCYAHLVAATLSTIPRAKASTKKFCASIDLPYQKTCFTMIENVTRTPTAVGD